MTRKTRRAAARRLAAASALVLWLGQSLPAAAEVSELILGCRHDPDDRILTLVCDRVEREAGTVAADAGYRVTLSVGKPVMPLHPAPGARTLDIQVTGTRPASQFGIKRIEALLSGSYAAEPAGGWESELTAEGAPRDLVHPIADALLTRIAAFLGTSPAE